MTSQIAPLVFAACLAAASPASAQVIRDDFSSGGLSPRNWFVCRRPENEFKLVQSEDAAFRAVEATVRRADELLAPFGVASETRELTGLLYLVDLAARYLTDRQAEAGARLGVLGTWLLPVLIRRVEEL